MSMTRRGWLMGLTALAAVPILPAATPPAIRGHRPDRIVGDDPYDDLADALGCGRGDAKLLMYRAMYNMQQLTMREHFAYTLVLNKHQDRLIGAHARAQGYNVRRIRPLSTWPAWAS